MSKEEWETMEDMEKVGCRGTHEDWNETGRCTSPIKVECWRK